MLEKNIYKDAYVKLLSEESNSSDIKRFLSERKEYYEGVPLETGGTSIPGVVSPAIRQISHMIEDNATILDYGAGKYSRHSNWFRSNGHKTYAYDPFNYNNKNPWEKDGVSSVIPSDITFDVVFSCFVFNVIPHHLESQLLKEVEKLGKKIFHVVRNKDIFDTVNRALQRKDGIIYDFFVKEFNDNKEQDVFTRQEVMEFCKFGVQTDRGFQRICFLEESGYKLIQDKHGYKIYSN